MRIGIDARLWNETGVGRYIRNLVWQLQKIDSQNEYVLFVRDSGGEAAPPSRWKIVKTDIRWHTVEEQIKFPQVLEKEKLDLVHFPYFAIPVFYNRPFVVTIHDLIIHHFPTGEASTLHPIVYHGKRLGYEYIMKRAAQKSKKIITVSHATKREIVDHLGVPAEKIVVTYEGIDASLQERRESPQPPLRKGGARSARDYFLYVGNAYPHKNLERLLLAFKEVSLKRKMVRLILVGKKDYFYNKVQKRIEALGLNETVEIIYDVSDETLQELYTNSLAVVLPSFMEGFGLPAVEAMANYQKLLVSDIPVFREVCADAATFFDPNDTEDLVNKLLEKIDAPKNPDDLKKIKAGIDRLEMFSWEKMAKDTLSIYESAIKP